MPEINVMQLSLLMANVLNCTKYSPDSRRNTGWMGSHPKHLHYEIFREITFSIHYKIFRFTRICMSFSLRIPVMLFLYVMLSSYVIPVNITGSFHLQRETSKDLSRNTKED